ncbi:MAG: (Fe-S)-binding protein [Desulfobacterales bacterium]|nr:MAG: (Fe-S)-binding protein [Desulfobacterales bacterium]
MEAEEVHRCVKCGLCLVTCPVYQELREESASPRAKVQLIKHYAARDLPTSPHLSELVSRCLMCGSCTANCPSGVRHDSLFRRMRSDLIDDYGENWKKKVLYHFLTHAAQLHWASKFAAFGRNVVLEKIAQEVKIGNIPLKRLPKFNQKPFRDQIADVIEPLGKPRGRVLYFTGCGTNYIYADVGRATVQVLQRMGYRVGIPKDQVCCGLPLFIQGSVSKTKENILKNIALFTRPDIDAVIVDCATCGSALRHEYPAVLADLQTDTREALELSRKVKDIGEFIFDNVEHLQPFLKATASPTIVTYHSPCHLRNAQGVKTHVEQLLEALPPVDYIRSVDFDSCCGGGGTFFYDHPNLSQRIVAKKIENAKATGARLLATGCPGCRVNLAGNLEETDAIEVVHPIQVVELGLKV